MGKHLAWILLLISPLSIHGENGDWQQWNEISWSQNLDYGFQPGMRLETRWEDDISQFSYLEWESMLTWRYSPRWDFTLGYERDERLEPVEETSHAPSGAIQLKLPLRDWNLAHRVRFEGMIPDGEGDKQVFMRHRTEWGRKLKTGGKTWTVSLFDEWFYEMTNGRITQNRVGIAATLPVVPHWNLQVYFLRQDESKMDGWEWHPVLGIQIQTSF